MKIEFTKMQGAGNDFVVIDDREDLLGISSDSVIQLCDRRFGIGADGVIRIGSSEIAQAFMDYRNADGTVAEMCGNGVRVVAKYLGDRKVVGDEMSLETRSGVKQVMLHREDGTVVRSTVDMGTVVLEGEVFLEDVDGGIRLLLANTGNPHAMLVVDDLDAYRLEVNGPLVEHHQKFPGGRNFPVVQAVAGGFRQRTWERGCGETLACGTAATASFAMMHAMRLVGDTASIELRGGTFDMAFAESGGVLLTGPAEECFVGRVSLEPNMRARGQ